MNLRVMGKEDEDIKEGRSRFSRGLRRSGPSNGSPLGDCTPLIPGISYVSFSCFPEERREERKSVKGNEMK